MKTIHALLNLPDSVVLSSERISVPTAPMPVAGSAAFAGAFTPETSTSPSFSLRLQQPVTVRQDDLHPAVLYVDGGALVEGEASQEEGWWLIQLADEPVVLIGHDGDGLWALELKNGVIVVYRAPQEETAPLPRVERAAAPLLPPLDLPEWRSHTPAWLADGVSALLGQPDPIGQLRAVGRLFRLHGPRGRGAAVAWGGAFRSIARSLAPDMRELILRTSSAEASYILDELSGCTDVDVAHTLLLARDDLQSIALLRQAHEPDSDLRETLDALDQEMAEYRTSLHVAARSAPSPLREMLHAVAVRSPDEVWGCL